jgi:hypothetical protein
MSAAWAQVADGATEHSDRQLAGARHVAGAHYRTVAVEFNRTIEVPLSAASTLSYYYDYYYDYYTYY